MNIIAQLGKGRKRWIFAVMDVILPFLIILAVDLIAISPISDIGRFLSEHWYVILIQGAIYPILFLIFFIYRINWVFCNAWECVRLLAVSAGCSAAGIFAGIILFPGDHRFLKLSLAACIIISGCLIGMRLFLSILFKIMVERQKEQSLRPKRTLVIGAGSLAVILLRDNSYNERINFKIVGLIDDDPTKLHQKVHGATVLGGRDDIERIVKEKNIELIIFAISTIDQQNKSELLSICSKTRRRVMILKGVEESLVKENGASDKLLRNVEIEDLLEREPIRLNNTLIGEELTGKVVLVTGGGGSIGSELCRQILRFQPAHLIILDIYENTTYEVQNELEEKYPDQKITVLIGSVREKARLDEIMEQYKPWIVFHAAAHKHVPLMEYSPAEAIKNNVFGTYNTARSAAEHGVRRFVMISTDKAVNPTNVMGASKRMCEMVVQTMQKCSDTEFVAVRFGNVLGSHGSVIPRFRKQIEQGGPVTVTHPDITRFFMTIPEAAQLVLQAASYAKGGEIFVLNMGKPVRIYDLAKKMISLSGLRPDEDIKIVFTGLRPGEKLYEELLMNEEGLTKTAHSKIFIGKQIDITEEELKEKLAKLESVLHADPETVKNMMAEVVPTYKRNKQD
ncbi:MAG: polysaccharide biosynthesis protein [Clostridia bacterium]|nr:polysaccharide biosynthesis protein [Clostridia bacterium]